MVDALVFSRDRPLQLEACLRSLYLNAPQVAKATVIYKATSDRYQEGYTALTDVYDLVAEGDFAADVRRELAAARPHVLLLCDDSLVYRALPDEDIRAVFEPDVICLSLGLGANTTYCYPLDLRHATPSFSARDAHRVWEWRTAPSDFDYPYSCDGTVHRRDSLLGWLEGGTFTNPNTMEDRIVGTVGRRADVPQLMASYPHSVLVGVPANVVNETHPNRCGHRYSPDELNERFLAGERIRFEAMDFTDIEGFHQEVAFEFYRP